MRRLKETFLAISVQESWGDVVPIYSDTGSWELHLPSIFAPCVLPGIRSDIFVWGSDMILLGRNLNQKFSQAQTSQIFVQTKWTHLDQA